MFENDEENQNLYSETPEIISKSGRPYSNRDIEQSKGTILKINPEEWNNVPVIVYESIATIV
jgi:hypothetical protein